jgi:hypothetical protein
MLAEETRNCLRVRSVKDICIYSLSQFDPTHMRNMVLNRWYVLSDFHFSKVRVEQVFSKIVLVYPHFVSPLALVIRESVFS